MARNPTALVPFTETEANLRAKEEINFTKHIRDRKIQEQKDKEQQALRKQTLTEKRLKEELQKRRVEAGIQQNVGGVK